MALYLIKYI